jgi:outer membrane protein
MRYLFIAFLFTTSILADAIAATPQIEAQAVELMKSGNPTAAYRLLKENFSTSQAGPQQWFTLGLAAKQAGELTEAKSAFEHVLVLDPRSQRAKLELAEVRYALGDSAGARQLMLDVKASGPPERVVQNIDRYLAVINQSEQSQSSWRVRGSAGFVYDSNVNQGTSAEVVRLYGLPFTLSQDARRRGDGAYQLKAEIDHAARLSATTSWQSNFTLSWRDYFRLHTYDTVSFNASTGPVWQVSPQLIVSVPAIASGSRLENGQSYYSVLTGVSPQIRYSLNPWLAFNIETTLGRKHYHEQAERDGTYLSAAPSIDIKTGPNGKLTAGLQFARENSGIGYFGNDAATINLSYLHQISPTVAAMMYGSYGKARYDEMELAYSEKRKDERLTFGADLVFKWNHMASDVVLSATHTKNGSNLPLYDFDRTQVSVTLRKQF